MKSMILASALAATSLLAGSASGRPFNHKRKLVTEVVYVTETVAEVIVCVDETGSAYATLTSERPSDVTVSVSAPLTTTAPVLSTSEASIPSSSATPAPAPEPTSSEEPSSSEEASSALFTSPPETTSVAIKDAIPTSTPSPTSDEPSYVTASPIPDSEDSLPLGITYDAFTGSGTNTQCKSEEQIASDFDMMRDYAIVRIYGSSCDQIALAIQNAVKNGQRIMGGAYLSNSGAGEDVSAVIRAYNSAINQYNNGNWDIIALFSIENEQVNSKTMTASEVVDAIGPARDLLRSFGYTGPVGAVETAPAVIDNPSICEASDVVMVNIHAFFDENTSAPDAGTFVRGQVDQVAAACNKRVVVTESGWPYAGDANGAAVPSRANQEAALDSIRASFSNDLFLFHAFDATWQSDTASTFNAERFWGVL
ncbi:glycoside hydrolase [Decorospora gaudefroyi]|uniref:Glycoside hydrolase n=1 Tax=Decorospora gaudefroyi TaxID=184978 RepID=A0A6A5L0G8_9PLEO|nr:glycoside hydrolase [Decorospora gaudefroyi]